MTVQPRQTHSHGKYDNNGSIDLRFGDDDDDGDDDEEEEDEDEDEDEDDDGDDINMPYLNIKT